MAAAWQNSDGLQVKFQNYWADKKNFTNRARYVNTQGTRKLVVFDYDLTQLPDTAVSYTADLNNDGTRDGFSDADQAIPANASITGVTLVVTEAAAGGTSITLGTFGKTGTAIDADGLITATEGVKANLDTVGARTYGAGAYVATTAETAGVGTADAYLALTGSGTWTAGKGRIYVEYLDPLGDS